MPISFRIVHSLLWSTQRLWHSQYLPRWSQFRHHRKHLTPKFQSYFPHSKYLSSKISNIWSLTIRYTHSPVQSLSCVRFFATPWIAACQASLLITSSLSLLKLMSIKLVKPYNHLILCGPLLFPPSIFLSIRVFSNESVLRIRWPKYCTCNFIISPSSKYSGLISFRIDSFDHLAVQGTVKSPPTPQFIIMNSSMLSFLYGPALTSIRDYWKNHRWTFINDINTTVYKIDNQQGPTCIAQRTILNVL